MHGSVCMAFNLTNAQTGPGQFKLDPFLIRTGALDSISKQTSYEANFFTTEDKNLLKTEVDRNVVVVPRFKRIADIDKERHEENQPRLHEEKEQYIIRLVEKRMTHFLNSMI